MLALLALLAFPSTAAFKLNELFSDGMVLQRGRATVYGTGAPGEKVSVAFAGSTYPVAVDPAGFFQQALPDPPPLDAAANFTLSVSNATSAVSIEGIVFGEVFVCSGQCASPLAAP